MNKQEIQNKIDQAKTDKQAINKNLQVLEKLLRKTEKPKLKHGDFGTNKEGDSRLVIKKTNDVLTLAGCCKLGMCVETVDEIREKGFIFGNIFDLLKEWSEDLDRTYIDGFALAIGRFCSDKIVIGGRSFLIEQAEEIWHKLGQLIATQKRKS